MNAVRFIVGAVIALVLSAPPAQAATYSFDYNSFDFPATFTFVVEGDQVVDISGAVSYPVSSPIADPILGIVPNPNFPGTSLSPDGHFTYNNRFYNPGGSGPHFDEFGVLFTTAGNPGGFWQLFFYEHDQIYKLYASFNGVVQESEGTLTPLPGALVLFLTALGGWNLLGWYRRRNAATAVPA